MTASPPSPTRRGLPLWAMLLLGLAGLCAVGCVAGFFLLSAFGARFDETVATAQVSGATTITQSAAPAGTADSALIIPTLEDLPTRPPEPTAAAAPTAGAAGGVAGGAAGVGGAAGTAGQAQTAQAQLTATAEIEQLLAEADQIFSDEFVDNRNAWFVGVFEEIETDTIEDGVFRVQWAASGTSYELYEVQELTNFIAEVDCRVVAGDVDASCGLVFGQQTDIGFYKFELFEDYYRLFIVRAAGDPELLAEGNPAGVVRPGDWNRLRVVKQGERIRVFVNTVLLADASDGTYATGKVGIATNSYRDAGGVEIQFDNFTLWELP